MKHIEIQAPSLRRVVLQAAAITLVGALATTTVTSRKAMGQAPAFAAMMAAQRDAMQALDMMDGLWRGSAWILLPSGEKHEMTQTERVGSFLGGTVKVIEGLGYEADGSVGFNALGVISFDPAEQAYSLRTYARGQSGDFLVKLADGKLVWEIPAGPMTIRYTATIGDGTWFEIGERIMPSGESIVFSELNLSRIGDTDWPASGRVSLH